jgi:hypothetical protein
MNEYVLPAVDDFKNNPASTHLAIHALSQIDILAEQMWLDIKRQPTSAHGTIYKFREAFRMKHPELGYAWDVHDIHKHGYLSRRVPVLPNDRRPTVACVGGAFQSGAFQSDAFQVGTEATVLTLQDNSQIEVAQVIAVCLAFWETELKNYGY